MAKPKTAPPPKRSGTIASVGEGGSYAREAWSIEGPEGARILKASGERRSEDAFVWSLTAGFAAGGQWSSADLQVQPVGRASEVTTHAFRCFGGAAFGTTIGPGGVPEKTQCAFPPGSAFRGFSFALDALTAVHPPVRLGHGRRLLVIELDASDLVPRIRDWMLLALSKERAGPAADAPWAQVYEFRPAEQPGRAQTTVAATADGTFVRGSAAYRGGTLEVRPG